MSVYGSEEFKHPASVEIKPSVHSGVRRLGEHPSILFRHRLVHSAQPINFFYISSTDRQHGQQIV